jgi:hypothetical protein
MSHFYGRVQGRGKTPATRTGTKSSGIQSHTCGWTIGIEVCITHKDGYDIVEVYETAGSYNSQAKKLVYREIVKS